MTMTLEEARTVLATLGTKDKLDELHSHACGAGNAAILALEALSVALAARDVPATLRTCTCVMVLPPRSDRDGGLYAVDSACPTHGISGGARDIATERERQISTEGWDAMHDDSEHAGGTLAMAAACYASGHVNLWPFDELPKWKSERENLVRAGALIAAEIDRLDRAATRRGRP